MLVRAGVKGEEGREGSQAGEWVTMATRGRGPGGTFTPKPHAHLLGLLVYQPSQPALCGPREAQAESIQAQE